MKRPRNRLKHHRFEQMLKRRLGVIAEPGVHR